MRRILLVFAAPVAVLKDIWEGIQIVMPFAFHLTVILLALALELELRFSRRGLPPLTGIKLAAGAAAVLLVGFLALRRRAF